MSLGGWFRQRPLEIRRAKPDDAPGCALIHQSSFARGWSSIEFESLISEATVIAHAAASRRGEIAGFSLCRIAADEAEIISIAVAANARRQGFGQRLLSAQIAELQRLPVAALFLEVEAGNQAARQLYARMAFQEAGRRKAYYGSASGPPADALILKRRL